MEYAVEEPRIDISILAKCKHLNLAVVPHDVRSKGTHLTQILQSAEDEIAGPREPKIVFGRNIFEPIKEDDLPMCMALGMAWEDFLMKLCPWLERIGERVKDGIAMSPDAITPNDRRHLLSPGKPVKTLDEIKLTWKSSKRLLEEHTRYLKQSKAYCMVEETEYCKLHVTFVNGNYKFGDDPNGGPHYLIYHIKYSPFELQTNWDWFKRKKRELGL